MKRFIKIFGKRISLDEVELQLRTKGFDVVVTVQDDLLAIGLRGNSLAADTLAAIVSAWYRLHHSAIRVKVVNEFPMSGFGKVRYADFLKEHFLVHPVFEWMDRYTPRHP